MSSPANEVTLWVDGQVHRGWESVGVELNLDHLSGAFDLGLSATWLENAASVPRLVKPGIACKLAIDGVAVITGAIDRVEASYDANSHGLKVAGRDRAGDLVDCSAEVKEYQNQSLEAIMAALAAPYGVKVIAQGDTGTAFERFAVNPGDTVGACFDRLTRQRGVLAWSDGQGNVIVGRVAAGRPVASLVRGVNVLSASAVNDASQRFSRYVVKGNRESTDGLTAAEIAEIEATATDSGVSRNRTLILIPETQGNTANLGERAAWEARVRAGRGFTITAKTVGWYHAGGLYRPGQTVSFTDDWLGSSGDFLISNVRFNKDMGGTVSTLTLCPPAAFDRLAEPEKGSAW
ncbi:MAG: phage baseplate assembly protein [Rhodospirillaceae bacterium]